MPLTKFKSVCVVCITAFEMALASAVRRINSVRIRSMHTHTHRETGALSSQE